MRQKYIKENSLKNLAYLIKDLKVSNALIVAGQNSYNISNTKRIIEIQTKDIVVNNYFKKKKITRYR